MSFDAILEHVGGRGRYQFLVFVITSLAMTFHGMMANLPVFITYKQKYQCRWTENSTGNESLVFDTCSAYFNETPRSKLECSSWDFDQSVFTSTIRSRYNLTCGSDFLAELSTTIFFLGFVLGSVAYGLLSDHYGRLLGTVIAGTHLSLFSIAASFAPNYTTFAAFRFIAGIGNGGMLACAFTMMAEVTDVECRVLMIELAFTGYAYGTGIMSLLGYFFRDDLTIQLAVACPILLVWVFPLLIPESPRWLFATGHLHKAYKAVDFVSRFNRRPIPDDVIDAIFREKTASQQMMEKMFNNKEKEATLMDLMRTKSLRVITLINWFSWFAVSTGFFAVTYTIGDIGGNLFLNLFYSAVIEVPARLMGTFLANRWGRIPLICLSLILGGLGCLLNACFISFPFLKTGLIVTSVFNRFWLTAAFDIIWAYSGELYPTVIRNVGVGVASMWARIGGMLSPQVSLLFDVWLPLPLILMGTLPILAGISFALLPETLHKGTLEEMEDMVQLIRTYSPLWRAKNTRKNRNTCAVEKDTAC